MSEQASPRMGRKGFWGGLGFLAVLSALYHFPALWGGETYVLMDDSRFFYPVYQWGSWVWGQGLLPLWNPLLDCGAPYWAAPQMACAYLPLRLIYALAPGALSAILAFNVFIAFHQFWAAAGFFLFARGRGHSAVSSLTASVVCAFSLHMTCSAWTPPALAALSWVPWVFFLAEATVLGKRWALWALSVSVALQMAAGYPVMAYLTGLGLVGTLCSRQGAFTRACAGWVPRVALAYAVALLYNLSWGLPFAEYFTLTNHGQDAAGYYQALHWKDLWTWLTPFPQGHPLASGYHGIQYWVASFHMGALVPVLLLWRVVRNKGEYGTLILFALTLWLSLGETAWLGGFLKTFFPGYHLVLRSGFWIGLVTFFAGVLVAEALDDIGSLPFRAAKGGRVLLGCLAILGLLPSLWSVRFTMPADYYRRPPRALALLSEDGLGGSPGRWMHSPRLLESAAYLRGKDLKEAYGWAKEALVPNLTMRWDLPCVIGYNTLGFKEVREWRSTALGTSDFLSRSALDHLSVRYLVGGHRFKDLDPLPETTVPLSENKTPLPLWYVAREARSAAEWVEEAKAMDAARKGFRDWTWVRGLGWEGACAPRAIRATRRGVSGWDLEIGSGDRTLLVSSIVAGPGWKAVVDGKPRRPLAAHHVFLGLELLPGDRRVRWTYEPVSLRLGLFFGLCSLMIWGAWGATLLWGKAPSLARGGRAHA